MNAVWQGWTHFDSAISNFNCILVDKIWCRSLVNLPWEHVIPVNPIIYRAKFIVFVVAETQKCGNVDSDGMITFPWNDEAFQEKKTIEFLYFSKYLPISIRCMRFLTFTIHYNLYFFPSESISKLKNI